MSADLTLIALDPRDLQLRADLATYQHAHAICDDPGPDEISWEAYRSVIHRLFAYPHEEVGQVSWLKAGLSGEPDRYVPGPVDRCVELVGDGVLLTPGVAKAITVAFNLPNRSIYGHVHYERVRDVERLEQMRREASAGCRGPKWGPALRHPDIAVYRKGGGIATGRTVKRFVQANLGAWVVHLSV